MDAKVKELKAELIRVLTELNSIKPVKFLDVDCDNCVYNFSDVRVDEGDNCVYVEIAMWHDNLPCHDVKPIG